MSFGLYRAIALQNRALSGVVSEIAHTQDDVLKWLRQPQPLVREGVAITHRGTARHQAKYNLTLAPAGTRFSFELRLASNEAEHDLIQDQHSFQQLLTLCGDDHFRLGASARSGLGMMKIIQLSWRAFHLKPSPGHEQDFSGFTALSAEFSDHTRLNPWAGHTPTNLSRGLRLNLSLKPEDFWRMGQGLQALSDGRDERLPDQITWTESRIEYSPSGSAHITKPRPILAGTGLKGAIAHRVAYHFNRRTGRFADQLPPEEQALLPREVQALFGCAADYDPKTRKTTGHAGRIWFSDVVVDLPDTKNHIGRQTHNKIDRFTGGVIPGALFEEELLYNTPAMNLCILLQDLEAIPPATAGALADALEDLTQGRLALGGGSSKGHGYFTGAVSGLEPLKQRAESANS